MLLLIVRLLYTFVSAGAIATYVSDKLAPEFVQKYPLVVFFGLLILTQTVILADLLMKKKRLDVITAVYFGLLIGLFLSYVLNQALLPLVENSDGKGVTMMCTTLILPYICISVLVQTKDDFRFIIPYVEFSREIKGGKPFLLDTSSIIDGRIADVVETKIIDSTLIVPNFILAELQEIADSSDKMRRNRGRRGLDVLSRLRANPQIEVKLFEVDLTELKGLSVDQKLVAVAKQLGGRVVTNDFNLNKVASVQGVDVINLNDVANSLKPRYLPGEHLNLKIIKGGEGPGQGIGYLDDGTMVVCEQAYAMIGKETQVVVTSVLQNSQGRMIFGKLAHSHSSPILVNEPELTQKRV